MKFLVLGCNGMAGHIVSLYLTEQGYDVCGFAKTPSFYVKSIVGNAYNTDYLSKIILEGNYDVIINFIGILNQFAEANKDDAVFLNSFLPHFLARVTVGMKTKVLHMSTDCVFSGKKGDYQETDFRDGETFYDRSKALGELEDSKNLTMRNSIIGPDIKPDGIGLMNWFMQQNGKVNGFTKAIWTGQTTLQLAKTMDAAIKEGITGLINAVPDQSISKYDLLMLFNKYLRKNRVKIMPVEGINLDKSLRRTRQDFNYVIPDYEKMIYELSQWMVRHKSMYPHYDL